MIADVDQDLYRRFTELLGAHDVHPEDRIRIQQALGPGVTWETLPADIRELVERLESELARQSWDDPADVPDDL